MSSSRRPSRRQLYQLNGASAGWITLRSGNTVYVEYNDWTDTNTQYLPYLRAALEYIAARVAERAHEDGQAFNNIQIRSVFHPTTMVGGERVMDPGGLHMTFDARAVLENGVVGHHWRSGHAYVTGFPPITQHAERDNFYHEIELQSISWEDGTMETSSGSSYGTTPRGGSPGGGSSRGSPRGGSSGSSGSKSGGSQSGSATKSGTVTANSRSGSTTKSGTVKGSRSDSGTTPKSVTAKGSSHSGSPTKSGSKPGSGRR